MSNKETIDTTIKSLKEMRDSLGDLSELMEGTQQVSDGLMNSFKDFATAGSSSKLWSAVSRFSSGIFPGFWSLQNKIRAVAVYMQYVETKQKEQIKREGEIAKTIDNQARVRMKAFEKYSILTQETYDIRNKLLLREDKYFKVLEQQVGFQEAKLKYTEQFKSVLLENIDAELAMSKVVIERIRNDKENEKFYKSAGIMRTKEMDSILYFREKENNLVQDILDAQMEMNRMRHDGEDYSALEEQQDALKKELKTVQDSAKLIRDRTGMDIVGDEVVKSDPKSRGDRFKGLFTAIPPYLKTAIMSIGPIGGIIKTMSWLGKSGNRRLFMQNAAQTSMFLGKVLLYISLLGFVVFLIHKSGIIGIIVDMFKQIGETFPVLANWFSDFWESFKKIFYGLYDFIMGTLQFFYGLFTGDSEKVSKGFNKAINGFWMLLSNLIITSFMTLLTLLGGPILAVLVATYEAGKKVAGKAGGLLTTAGATAGAIKGFSATAATGNPLLIAGATIGGGIIGGIGGAGLGAVGNFIFGGNASGGLIQRTGNYLVGEAGPEIVSLPAGTQVTPNNQMRGGGQVVNVYVNGRLGASDRELNEIGRKVGMKINREINKSNNIGVTLGSKAGSAVGRMI